MAIAPDFAHLHLTASMLAREAKILEYKWDVKEAQTVRYWKLNYALTSINIYIKLRFHCNFILYVKY